MNDFSRNIEVFDRVLGRLIHKEWLKFDHVTLRTTAPEIAGVYRVKISLPHVERFYIGWSRNLRDRLYGKHLSGAFSASTLKKKICADQNIVSEADARIFLIEFAKVQWVTIRNHRFGKYFEHYAIGVTFPDLND